MATEVTESTERIRRRLCALCDLCGSTSCRSHEPCRDPLSACHREVAVGAERVLLDEGEVARRLLAELELDRRARRVEDDAPRPDTGEGRVGDDHADALAQEDEP